MPDPILDSQAGEPAAITQEPSTQVLPAVDGPSVPTRVPDADDSDDESDIVAFRDAYRPLRALSKAARIRVYRWLGDKLGLAQQVSDTRDDKSNTDTAPTPSPQTKSNTPSDPQIGTREGGNRIDGAMPERTPHTGSARDFMKEKKPKNMSERAACLAHFLRESRKQDRVTTAELNQLNEDSGLTKWSNPTAIVDNATRRDQYLAVGSEGTRSLTPRGEAVVDALPDRGKVATALEEHPLTLRRGKKKAVKAK